MANLEIEIQVQVENIKTLLKFLESKCGKSIENRQIDIYYTPAHKNYIENKPVKEWLRLRDEDGTFSVTYKNWHHDENGKSRSFCDEYETKIDNIDQMKMVFESLSIKQIAVIDKKRTKYNYKSYEISIDKVVDLGDFIEIEYKGDGKAEDAKKITDGMIAFLKENKVGKIYRNFVGYPFQILFPEDITFEEY